MELSKNKGKKRAVTLVEFLIVVIILGILTALALPMFGRAFEATRAKVAVAALNQIRTGQRIYKTEVGFYYPHPTEPAGDTVAINEYLLRMRFGLLERNWTYTVYTNTTSDFTATATRRGGSATYDGTTITIDEQGGFGGDWPLPLPRQQQ